MRTMTRRRRALIAKNAGGLYDMSRIPTGAGCAIRQDNAVNTSASLFNYDGETVYANISLYAWAYYYIPIVALETGTYRIMADVMISNTNANKQVAARVVDVDTQSVIVRYSTLAAYNAWETISASFAITSAGNYRIGIQSTTSTDYNSAGLQIRNIRLYKV